ncbi:MAG: DUF2848 domain-containing protein [Devosiaceae bacterium]
MQFHTDDGLLDVEINTLTIAGWTGRDAAGVQHHIDELKAIGVPPPTHVPLFYKVSASLLVQSHTVQALGEETSGEAEPFLLRANDVLWLGVASDHTDRGLEATSVAHSKQVCAKPVANRLWCFDEVADRLDSLQLSSTIEEGGIRVAYQNGTLDAIRPLVELLERNALGEGDAMLCGTLPAIGGVRPSAKFQMALSDPANGRSIEASYGVQSLPVIA